MERFHRLLVEEMNHLELELREINQEKDRLIVVVEEEQEQVRLRVRE